MSARGPGTPASSLESKPLAPGVPAWRHLHPGNTPLPDHGLGGAALSELWRELAADFARCWELRQQPAECPHGHREYCKGCSDRRYSLKVKMKQAESMLGLIHGIIAPDAPFACDASCRHVDAGMTPEQCKRFLDTLQHWIDDREEYTADKPDADWALDELDDSRALREKFLRHLGSRAVTDYLHTPRETRRPEPARKGKVMYVAIGDVVLYRAGEDRKSADVEARWHQALRSVRTTAPASASPRATAESGLERGSRRSRPVGGGEKV